MTTHESTVSLEDHTQRLLLTTTWEVSTIVPILQMKKQRRSEGKFMETHEWQSQDLDPVVLMTKSVPSAFPQLTY